jgi:lysophospholipase L1-like esterase
MSSKEIAKVVMPKSGSCTGRAQQRLSCVVPTSVSYARYVALGDSSTEGLEDSWPDGSGYRGWANRFAEHVAAAQREPLLYANLAVRGRKTREVRSEQLDAALAMRPDLATVFSGVNDVVRRSCDVREVAADLEFMLQALRDQGATVLTITMPDLSVAVPLARLMRTRLLALNDHVREACERTGALCVDLAAHDVTTDMRLWDADRLHANSEGHRRIAAALAESIGVGDQNKWWTEPLPSEQALGAAAAVAGELRWARDYLLPWVWRQARGISSGDGRTAKRPHLVKVERHS